MECPNCWEKNENGSEYCKTCGFALKQEDLYNFDSKEENIETSYSFFDRVDINSPQGQKIIKIIKGIVIISILPFFLVGLGLMYDSVRVLINGYDKTQDYVKTTAVFKRYQMCHTETRQELCGEIYQYKVDEIPYEVLSDSDISNNQEYIDVYYNPKNPQEHVLSLEYYNDYIISAIMGLAFIIIPSLFYITFNKKIHKGIEDYKMKHV